MNKGDKTAVQPRYEATILRVGRTTSVTSHSGKHGSHTHNVTYLTVEYTDRDGTRQTGEAKYARPSSTLAAGQPLVLVWGADGLIPYPWSGLRLFGGVLAFGPGLFLFFFWLEKNKKARVQQDAGHRES